MSCIGFGQVNAEQKIRVIEWDGKQKGDYGAVRVRCHHQAGREALFSALLHVYHNVLPTQVQDPRYPARVVRKSNIRTFHIQKHNAREQCILVVCAF